MTLYKIRKTTTNNKTGDSFGITVPKDVAQDFSGVNFSIAYSEKCIIFISGCEPNYRNRKNFFQLIGSRF